MTATIDVNMDVSPKALIIKKLFYITTSWLTNFQQCSMS